MFDGIYFEYIEYVAFITLFIGCALLCPMRLPSIYFPHSSQFLEGSVSKTKLLSFLKWMGVLLLILALMSPVKDEEVELDPKDGFDIALVIDASQSMIARGFNPANPMQNRFDVVKEIVSSFVKERVNDNLGVVVFGKYSFVAAPLTYDKNIISRVVDQLYIGMAGKFTALFESLAQAANLLHNSKAKTKIAILLTDGENTAGGKVPLEAALELAKKNGVRVYTIGIGAPHEYNGELLKLIADETGGMAFGAQTSSELEKIYEKIDELEKSEIERNSYSYKHYYYTYPLFFSFLFLLAYVYLRNRKEFA